MTTINLKDFYACYTEATYIEVSNEVTDKPYSAVCQRRTKKNADEGISSASFLAALFSPIAGKGQKNDRSVI